MKNVEGVEVLFPFNPYSQQLDYSQHLLSAIKRSKSAILEYPRGGGRAMASLTSSLAWLEGSKNYPKSKLIYVCRSYNRIPEVK